ncbi:hypothetical protein HMPREF1544_05443 [Mucor circinelloides 1006PhL]|uniref:Uncharacterized protein n=1 Tax=Mucor circinelloides f. circinelloides (strain 1006PhL) TaxID=1220926 RepID=S2JYB6_MUCC1|nr:hypothetical protein HMPREF1544_05443 [Mucor circinelloides 1006PhL]KAG1106809.1 hypothetical protein G6F42_016606 [Rhizopus arrhizus]
MLYFKTIALMFLVTIYTTLIQDVLCRTVVATGSQRLVISNKRRISYSKRDAASAPALPNIQLPNADTTALLASAGPLLASLSSVKVPQLPALPGAASAGAAAAPAPAPAAGYPAPAGYPPQYQAAPAPKAAKKDEDEEEEDEDED